MRWMMEISTIKRQVRVVVKGDSAGVLRQKYCIYGVTRYLFWACVAWSFHTVTMSMIYEHGEKLGNTKAY
jgi:hypothetical protein